MLNTILFLGILCFFIYAFYDQFLMDKLKGKSHLKVRLKKQAKLDSLIFIVLIILPIQQAYSQKDPIAPMTLFLIATAIILSVYGAFIRSPVLLLKEKGFFFGNIYIDYDNIQQINLADKQILVIDLKNGKRLLVHLINAEDIEKVVTFFGGYKK